MLQCNYCCKKIEGKPYSFLNSDIVWCSKECSQESIVAKMANPVRMTDNVNHPQHYTSHPSGVECIRITEHMSFTLGNALKYIWRADLKNGTEDLKKAMWYLEREISKREKADV